MARKTSQQEVLLVISSGFASKQYSEREGSESSKNQSQAEKFKDACWNGMLKEILPELFFRAGPETPLFLWQMRECKHVLALEMAEEPYDIDFQCSIDPYCFLELQGYN